MAANGGYEGFPACPRRRWVCNGASLVPPQSCLVELLLLSTAHSPRSPPVQPCYSHGPTPPLLSPLTAVRFSDADNEPTTVVDYFRHRYGIILQYPNLPCLRVGPEKHVCAVDPLTVSCFLADHSHTLVAIAPDLPR